MTDLLGLAVANLLNSNSPVISSSSMPVAVVETKQGMYKEYTVEVEDDGKVQHTISGNDSSLL